MRGSLSGLRGQVVSILRREFNVTDVFSVGRAASTSISCRTFAVKGFDRPTPKHVKMLVKATYRPVALLAVTLFTGIDILAARPTRIEVSKEALVRIL